jgi:hypothetical protein
LAVADDFFSRLPLWGVLLRLLPSLSLVVTVMARRFSRCGSYDTVALG